MNNLISDLVELAFKALNEKRINEEQYMRILDALNKVLP